MREAALALALVLAAACSPLEAPSQPEPAPIAAPTLSPDGYGAIRIGMTAEEASAAFGHTLNPDGAENPADCETYHLDPGIEPQGMRFLTRDGRLARIDEHGSEGVATVEGVVVGASADAVRAAYPGVIEAPGEHDPPTSTLTVWTVSDQRGYRFHIYEGRVTSIAAGDAAIQLTEGCS